MDIGPFKRLANHQLVRWPSWLWRQVKEFKSLDINILVEQSAWVQVPLSSSISFFPPFLL
ncbi:hypothetical protein F4810DRAFT_690273 [Camillea tinctor]|nr:hypothetical protein F4810DRAFT_690273 [Camillea tinctor]